jgi:hypothetical protein
MFVLNGCGVLAGKDENDDDEDDDEDAASNIIPMYSEHTDKMIISTL